MSEAEEPKPYHHGTLRTFAIQIAIRHLRAGSISLPTVRELAAEIGVTHRALYRHFADKDALKAAVAGAGFEILCDAIESGSADQPPAPRDLMRRYIAFAIAEPGLYGLMFSLPASGLMQGPEPGEQVRRLIRLATTAFSAVRSSRGDLRDSVISAWGMSHGLVALWRGGALRANSDAQVTDFILDRLSASGLV